MDWEPLRIVQSQVDRLEAELDDLKPDAAGAGQLRSLPARLGLWPLACTWRAPSAAGPSAARSTGRTPARPSAPRR